MGPSDLQPKGSLCSPALTTVALEWEYGLPQEPGQPGTLGDGTASNTLTSGANKNASIVSCRRKG